MANQTCNPAVITEALGIQATGPRTVIVPADPIIWDAETSYEYLTLVASTDFGQAYISKKDVPSGTPLTNTEYWIPAASYNAQLAAIQTQLASMSDEISDASDNVTSLADKLKYADYTGRKITVFSDSTFQSNSTTGVAAILGEVSGATVTNLGVGGYSTTNVLSQVNELSSIDADYVIVACGVNDFQGNYEILPYNAISNINNLYSNVCSIIERIQSLSPSSQVTWVCHAYYHNNAYDSAQTNAYGLTLKEYNDVIEYACSNYNVGCIRLDEIMGINVNNYASQLLPSGDTGIHVHFNQANEYRVAALILQNMPCGYGNTSWSDGTNLIYNLFRYAPSMLTTEDITSNFDGCSIKINNGSTATFNFHTLSYGTLYVSGYTFGTIQINHNGNKIFSTNKSGFFCCPFEYNAGELNDIVVYGFNSDAYVIGLAVTKARNNPALSPVPKSCFTSVMSTDYGKLTLTVTDFTATISGHLTPSSITVNPNENITTIDNWVGINMIGEVICIKSGVITGIPARIASTGELVAVGSTWTQLTEITELYVSMSGSKFIN